MVLFEGIVLFLNMRKIIFIVSLNYGRFLYSVFLGMFGSFFRAEIMKRHKKITAKR